MPTDLIPYSSSPLSLRGRQAVSEVREARRPVRRSAARVQAAALVAHVGMANVEALTSMEVQMARRQGPVIDQRAREIVDAYTGLVVTEIGLLALRGE